MFRWMQALGFALLALVAGAAAGTGTAAEPYVLLEAVRDGEGRRVLQADAQGQHLPVLKPAGDTPVVRQARRALASGFTARIPAIDAAARQAAARQAAARKAQCPALPEAVYVFLSDEDGGYARHRFYVADQAGAPVLCDDHFVDLTADPASIASGEFEEVLAHEWGHVLLRRLLGPVPPTPSRKFHSVRAITDPVTAFDEGFGAHLQPLSARLTETPGYRARIEGTAQPRLADFWFSRQETWMRQALVPQNRLVFDKAAPAVEGDAYARWLADEASASFDPCRLISGGQMVASEGVAASFFHQLFASEPQALEARYRQFIAVLARMGGWPEDKPALIAFAEAWADVYPQERQAVLGLLAAVTHGATISREAWRLQKRTACAGASGDIEAFLGARKAAQAALDAAVADVLAGRVGLGAALGPQLWLANPQVKIAIAPWQPRRTEPLATDLNTARAAELALLFTDTPLAGKADAIVQARDAGPFASLEDAAERAGLDAAGLAALQAAARAVEQVGAAVRE